MIRVVRKLVGAILMALAAHLLLRELGGGSFHPFPLTVFSIGLFLYLDFVHAPRTQSSRRYGPSPVGSVGTAGLVAAVLWAGTTSALRLGDAAVIWGAGIFGCIGVVCLAVHHWRAYKYEIADTTRAGDND
jgi:hypothetical protein